VLFNSFAFLFLYLPCVLGGFFLIAHRSRNFAATFLALASLAFYGFWNPAYVSLLLGSIVGNFILARRIGASNRSPLSRHVTLIIAVSANLCLLGYYKYAHFFVVTTNDLTGTHLSLADITLPLGISFFTFTQIAFLVDTYRAKATEPSFVHFVLFVTYFPHLIAGPILHHSEMMPQFAAPATYRLNWENLAVGTVAFTIGLFKKVVIADSLAAFVGPVFSVAAAGHAPTAASAWGAAFCYAFQLYFDFSGYCDMAIGASRLFGIVLPLNFNSPYQAENIIEFWRRWHMTLSRFLRDYLYIPLGGNRHGPWRRYLNLFVTMLLGGLWHGAGWTFVLWGVLHGSFLGANHLWQTWRPPRDRTPGWRRLTGRGLAVLFTFLLTTLAWIPFRADSIQSAWLILHSLVLPPADALDPASAGYHIPGQQWLFIAVLSVVVWFAPNTQAICEVGRHGYGIYRPQLLRNVPVKWAGALTCIVLLTTLFHLQRVSTFLYYRF
jgi:alginate O-acetyltransferase complex protein AlgI